MINGINISWINHAGFTFKSNGMTAYIDPFKLKGNYPKADVIFITHPHYDHLSKDDLAIIAKADTQFVIPKTAQSEIQYKNVKGVEPGSEGEVLGIYYNAVPAYNNESERLKFHPKSNKWVGYIIEIDGKKVYHAGDTDLIDEMHSISVDLAFIPMGSTYTMDVDSAIKAAGIIKAKAIAPMHYKALLGASGSASAEKKFKEKVSNSTIMKEIQEPTYSF